MRAFPAMPMTVVGWILWVYHLEGGSGNAIDSSPLRNNLPGINSPTLVQTGIAGVAYKTNDTDLDGFLSESVNGSIKAKEGTYSLGYSPLMGIILELWSLKYNSEVNTYLH